MEKFSISFPIWTFYHQKIHTDFVFVDKAFFVVLEYETPNHIMKK